MLAFYIAGAVITYATVGWITRHEIDRGLLNWFWAMTVVAAFWPLMAAALFYVAWIDRGNNNDEI